MKITNLKLYLHTKVVHSEEMEKNSALSPGELEAKIIELNLKLKSKNDEIDLLYQTNTKIIRKLNHNLKNPVGVILSFSEMMIEDLELYTPEKLTKHLQIINNSANFSIELLNNVSKFTRLRLPGTRFIFSNKNFIEIIEAVLNEFEEVALKTAISIKRVFPDKAIILALDEDEIKEAIRNIINNAFRYSTSNTTVTISVKENTDTVELIITDEGIGISEKDIPAVLTEFHVVNTYSEDRQKCVGLGLTLANKIVERHKGQITISSTLGKGSSFKIILPKN